MGYSAGLSSTQNLHTSSPKNLEAVCFSAMEQSEFPLSSVDFSKFL